MNFSRHDEHFIGLGEHREGNAGRARERVDDGLAWQAVKARDRCYDGRFVTGVLSTGIYCRPSCAARHPKRANVRFFAEAVAARAAGLRPCKRCRPDDVARDEAAAAKVRGLIENASAPLPMARLAEAGGYSEDHLRRLFKSRYGLTPSAYARALRAERAERAVRGGETSLLQTMLDAGYESPSRFADDIGKRYGMAPSALRGGGAGCRIFFATVETSMGSLLVAATVRGVCRIAFDESSSGLAARFPNARLGPGDADFVDWVSRVVAQIETPSVLHDIPVDIRGTAFQQAVWRALSRIPPGETLSYAALAAAAGRPGAARAAGSACGANPVAVLVPCHRAIRADGSAGGYAWGLDRKAELLRRERKASTASIGSTSKPEP